MNSSLAPDVAARHRPYDPGVVHLRIVAPNAECHHVIELLEATDSVFNVVHLPNVATKPTGDLVLCDVARRDVSLLVADLRELNVDVDGSIAIEEIDAEISGLTSERSPAPRATTSAPTRSSGRTSPRAPPRTSSSPTAT